MHKHKLCRISCWIVCFAVITGAYAVIRGVRADVLRESVSTWVSGSREEEEVFVPERLAGGKTSAAANRVKRAAANHP